MQREMLGIVATLVVVAAQPPQPCRPCGGHNSVQCGYQCYGENNPCNDCLRENACGPDCCSADGVNAATWMNSVACSWSAEFRNGSAVCDDFKTCTYPICLPISNCTNGTHESSRPTPTSDRVCTLLHCTTGVTYASGTACKNVTVCNTSFLYQVVAPTNTSDRVCANLTTGLADAISSAEVLARNGANVAAAEVLEIMLSNATNATNATWAEPLTYLRGNATSILVNLRSGYTTLYDRTHYVSGSLQWDAPGGPLDQLTTLVKVMSSYDTMLNSLKEQKVTATVVAAAVAEIESNVSRQLGVLSDEVEQNTALIYQMQHTLWKVLTQVQHNGDMLSQIQHSLSAPKLNVFGQIAKACGLPSNWVNGINMAGTVALDAATVFSTASSLMSAPETIENIGAWASSKWANWVGDASPASRKRRTFVGVPVPDPEFDAHSRRIQNNTALESILTLNDLAVYVAVFDYQFTNGSGWDMDGNLIANSTEATSFLNDIGADAAATSAVGMALANGDIGWPLMLATPVDVSSDSSSSTSSIPLGQYAVTLLQSGEQPFRAKLSSLLAVWIGLNVAAKPIIHLADLPQPTASTCYGVSVGALVNTRRACAAHFPAGCDNSTGYGPWDNTTAGKVLCNNANKVFVDSLIRMSANMTSGFSIGNATLSASTARAAHWVAVMTGRGPSVNSTINIPPPNVTHFEERHRDLLTFNTVMTNLRAFQSGALVLGDPQHQPYNLTCPDLDAKYAELYQDFLGIDMTQYFHSVAVFTAGIGAAQHAAFEVQSALAGALVRRFRQPPVVPECLIDATTCAPDALDTIIGYVQGAQSNVANEALTLLSTTREAFLFTALDPSIIEQYTGDWGQLSTTANFEQAIADLQSAWSVLADHLAFAGSRESIQFEFLRSDHPAEFQSLDETGIISITVPWPNSTRERRAKLLAPTAKAYLPGMPSGGVGSVSVSMVHGPYSVFLPLDSKSPTGGVTMSNDWLMVYSTSSQVQLSIPEFVYSTSTCATLTSPCTTEQCGANDYVLHSPYGGWTLLVDPGTSVNGSVTGVYSGVDKVVLVFDVWFYSAGPAGGARPVFADNPCDITTTCLVDSTSGPNDLCHSSSSADSDKRKASGLPRGAVIGIAVGAGIVLLAVAAAMARVRGHFKPSAKGPHGESTKLINTGNVYEDDDVVNDA